VIRGSTIHNSAIFPESDLIILYANTLLRAVISISKVCKLPACIERVTESKHAAVKESRFMNVSHSFPRHVMSSLRYFRQPSADSGWKLPSNWQPTSRQFSDWSATDLRIANRSNSQRKIRGQNRRPCWICKITIPAQ